MGSVRKTRKKLLNLQDSIKAQWLLGTGPAGTPCAAICLLEEQKKQKVISAF
jgi:hypothetical protein